MEALTQKLDTLSFAVAGAIYGAALVSLATIAALLGIPGLRPFTDLLTHLWLLWILRFHLWRSRGGVLGPHRRLRAFWRNSVA